MEQQKLIFLKSVNERMESRGKRKKVVDPEDRFVATIADEHRQLPHEIKNPLFRYQLQILDKQNTTQGNFNNQNVNNRNSFVSQLVYQLSYHSIPHMEIPSQFNNHTTKTMIVFEVQKIHITFIKFSHLLTLYLKETKQILNIYRMRINI